MTENVEQQAKKRSKEGQTDWERLRAMTEEEIYQNALSDPDNQPLSESDFHSLKVRRISHNAQRQVASKILSGD